MSNRIAATTKKKPENITPKWKIMASLFLYHVSLYKVNREITWWLIFIWRHYTVEVTKGRKKRNFDDPSIIMSLPTERMKKECSKKGSAQRDNCVKSFKVYYVDISAEMPSRNHIIWWRGTQAYMGFICIIMICSLECDPIVWLKHILIQLFGKNLLERKRWNVWRFFQVQKKCRGKNSFIVL